MRGAGRDGLEAVQRWRRSPGFASTAILTLALGVGANTAIFAIAREVFLSPPAYDDPQSLVRLQLQGSRVPLPFTLAEFEEFRDAGTPLSPIAAYREQNEAVVTSADGSWLLPSAGISPEVLPLLGLTPQLGRRFVADDARPGTRTAILSDRAWRARFGADPDVIGQRLSVDDGRYTIGTYTVIGVMPPEMEFPTRTTDIWVSIPIDPAAEAYRQRSENVRLLGRVDRTSATDSVADALTADFKARRGVPDDATTPRIFVERLLDAEVADARFSLTLLGGIVGSVLLIATINLSGLLLGRFETRRTEIAVRSALGASRWQLVRATLVEGGLIGLAGALGAFVLAGWASGLLVAVLPPGLARPATVRIDLLVFGVSVGLAVLSAVAASALPSLGCVRFGQASLLDRGTGRSMSPLQRLRRPLIVGQVALVVPIVAAAGLLAKTLARIESQEAGLDPSSVLALRLDARRPDMASLNAYFEDVLAEVRGVPGVAAASIVRALPFSGGASVTNVRFPDVAGGEAETVLVDYAVVHSGFFETLGIPILSGRDFTPADSATAPSVAVINQAFADRYFPNRNPIGEHLDSADGFEVIGVVGNIRRRGLREPARPEMYVAYGQVFNARGTRQLLVSIAPAGATTAAILRDRVLAVDTAVAITEVRMMTDVLADSVSAERGLMRALGLAALLATALASVGLYGVVAYAVSRRFREFGLRMAVGADRRDVWGLVIREGMVLATTGLVLGLAISLASGQVLSSFLFEVEPRDPWILGVTAGTLTVVAFLAILTPALRATRADPMMLLRAD